jgi:Apea-like HEPN
MIHDHRTPQTNVSIRRILRAVSERKEPEDTLIDAVIVWENLFGSSQETTLRVTMSVAWMLGTDGNNRSALCTELKKVYQQRSDIVHGNAKLKTGLTSPYARRAIEVSIQLLRIMFRDHPELLKLKSGAERSALMLLNALDTLEE